MFLALVFVIVNLIVDVTYGFHRPGSGQLMSVAQAEELTLSRNGRRADSGVRHLAGSGATRPASSASRSSASSSSSRSLHHCWLRTRPRSRTCSSSQTDAAPGRHGNTSLESTSSERRAVAHHVRRPLFARRRSAVGVRRTLDRGSYSLDRRISRRMADSVVMRGMDILLAIPSLLLAIESSRCSEPGSCR